MATKLISPALSSIKGGISSVSKRIFTVGSNVKNRAMDALINALERFGFKTPRTRKAKRRELKKVQPVIEEEIEDLQEQERENVRKNI